MGDRLEIREGRPGDEAAIEALYPDAFPDEDLLPLVKDLLQMEPAALSLVGVIGSSLVGHVVFTRCRVGESNENVDLLAPLAVAPAFQKQGVGSALVRAGLDQQARAGAAWVYVLGDPNYYKRFGFLPETAVTPPYPLPDEWLGAWQSIALAKAAPPPRGKLSVPRPWRRPALWAD